MCLQDLVLRGSKECGLPNGSRWEVLVATLTGERSVQSLPLDRRFLHRGDAQSRR